MTKTPPAFIKKLVASVRELFWRHPVFAFYSSVSLAAALAFLPGLGSCGMLDPTDSFFVEAPREMLALGNYWTPLINYENWYDKPALPFLLIIASYKLFGVSAWAARLPSALSGIILTVLTAGCARRVFGWRVGLLSALVMSSCALLLIVGRSALTDEPLALFFGAAMLWLGEALICNKPRMLLGAYAALGLAILCKGPIGLVLALGSGVLFALLKWWHSGRNNAVIAATWQSVRPWQGAAILALISLPYFLFVHVTTGGAFTEAFFLRQNVGRFAGTVNHQEPMWWYLPVFVGGYFPWSISLFAAYRRLRKIWLLQQWSQVQEFLFYVLAWMVFVLALFTLVPTKLPTYIVPMTPALALIVSYFLPRQIARIGTLVARVGWMFTMISAIVVAAILPRSFAGAGALATPTYVAAGIIFCEASIQLYWLRKRRLKLALYNQLVVLYSAFALFTPIGFEMFYLSHQVKIDRLVSYARNNQVDLATLYNRVPSVMFAYKHHIEELDSLEGIRRFAGKGNSRHWLLATRNCFDVVGLNAKQHIVACEGKWYLIAVDELAAAPKH